MTEELEPLAPKEALELYLKDREQELAESTLYSHGSRLSWFANWCEQENIHNLNELSGRDLMRFKHWRRDQGDLKPISLDGQLSTLRVFIQFCENLDAVRPELHEQIAGLEVSESEQINGQIIAPERAAKIRRYLNQFEYASNRHVVFSLAWETDLRLGGIRALDVDDYSSSDEIVQTVHRPESGTPLKNGENGERQINLSPSGCELVDQYLEHRRPPINDEYGRGPLLATNHGRMAKSTIRRFMYQVTRPCEYEQECPHNRDLDTCQARRYRFASRCPSSRSPHSVRRGSITYLRESDVSIEVITERVNASRDVIEKHYDQRSEEQHREQRRRELEKKLEEF